MKQPIDTLGSAFGEDGLVRARILLPNGDRIFGSFIMEELTVHGDFSGPFVTLKLVSTGDIKFSEF